MRVTKKIAKRLNDPTLDPESAAIFGELVNALDGRGQFDISRLFKLNYDDFELTLKLLVDWRLHQFAKPAGGLKQVLDEADHENHYRH